MIFAVDYCKMLRPRYYDCPSAD